jgi:hypothetical protein
MKKLLDILFIGNIVLTLKRNVKLAIPKISLWFILPLILIGLFTVGVVFSTRIILSIISLSIFAFGLFYNIRYIK